MSIVRLNKVTLIGLTADRNSLLENLQAMGCVELIPLQPAKGASSTSGPTPGAEEALKFLRDCPDRRRQVKGRARFDVAEVEKQVLAVRERLHGLEEERDFLIERIQDLRVWGDFEFPALAEMGNLNFWFYVVPFADLAKVQALAHYQEIIRHDHRFNYVVVISATEPADMPVPRVHLGAKPRHALEDRLDEVELAIEDTRAERAYLTRWFDLFRLNLAALKDRATLSEAANLLSHQDPVVALQGWIPADRVSALADHARKRGLCFRTEEPAAGEFVPTLLENTRRLSAGEDLVNFYMTPGYRTWDPSSTIFVSFTLFFAMILADAGYAAILGLVLLCYWKKMGESAAGRHYRPLCTALVGASLIYGILIGGYFGVEPPEDSLRARFQLLHIGDTNRMMAVSALVGCLHVILATVMDALRYPRWIEGLVPIGWALIVSAGLVLVLNGGFALTLPQEIPIALASLGALLVLLYSAPAERPVKRIVQGLLGLTHLSTAFGDVLSYLRLFALGLASGSLAMEFNRMATGIIDAFPGFGLFFALLVLILGHSINLVLGLASAVIHGMRLNVIEFFKWGLKEEGSLFRPLKRADR